MIRPWSSVAKLLLEKRDLVEKVAQLLVEKEVISQNDLVKVLGERIWGYGPHAEFAAPTVAAPAAPAV